MPPAIQLLREAVGEHPEFAEAHRDLAHALLLNGEYREGWVENRWRWGTGSLQYTKRHQSIPEWTGQPLTGKRILVWDEQGFGDRSNSSASCHGLRRWVRRWCLKPSPSWCACLRQLMG